jgi:hypothetical protein
MNATDNQRADQQSSDACAEAHGGISPEDPVCPGSRGSVSPMDAPRTVNNLTQRPRWLSHKKSLGRAAKWARRYMRKRRASWEAQAARTSAGGRVMRERSASRVLEQQ